MVDRKDMGTLPFAAFRFMRWFRLSVACCKYVSMSQYMWFDSFWSSVIICDLGLICQYGQCDFVWEIHEWAGSNHCVYQVITSLEETVRIHIFCVLVWWMNSSVVVRASGDAAFCLRVWNGGWDDGYLNFTILVDRISRDLLVVPNAKYIYWRRSCFERVAL
jgi:hypothetical protein